jgi:erythronate-4-phosphate dehydrogenase
MRIIADREITEVASAFAEFGTVELVAGRTLRSVQLRDASILLVRSVTRVDEDLLGGTRVSFVGTATAGTDHVDIDYLTSQGITFSAAPGCNARAVAEHVLACVLLRVLDEDVDPARLTAGVIGYGNTGTAVTSLLRRLGVTCKLNDPPLAETDTRYAFVTLDEALDADIVTLHVPLTENGPYRTRNLIDTRAVGLLPPRAVLINTARGGVVDEPSLIAALDGRSGLRAAIDCWQGEPAIDHGLLERAFVATPHIAGHSLEARRNATVLLHQALARHLGQTPRWRPAETAPEVVHPAAADGPLDLIGFITRAVFASDDPRSATVLLKRAVGLPAARVGTYFDEVRRSLGGRREFSGHVIATPGLTPDTVAVLETLGFRMDPCTNMSEKKA